MNSVSIYKRFAQLKFKVKSLFKFFSLKKTVKSKGIETLGKNSELYYIYSQQEIVHFYNNLEEAYNKAIEWADGDDDDFFHIGKVRECEFYISNDDKTLISFEKVQKLFHNFK